MKTMVSKRFRFFRLPGVLVLSALMLTACGASELSAENVSEKQITITAKNAAKDDSLLTGALVVGEGEQIRISSGSMEKGTIRVEILETDEEQSIDQAPAMDGGAVLTADISTTEGIAGTVPVGTYMVRVTCLEKSTGTLDVVVEPAS